MTTMATAMKAIVDAVKALYAPSNAVVVNGITYPVTANRGWPSQQTLQTVPSNNKVIIGLTDRKYSQNRTRWMPRTVSEIMAATQITTTLSNVAIQPGGTATITVGLATGASAPNLNDAISCVIIDPYWDFSTAIKSPAHHDAREAAVFTAPAGATTGSIATGLAAAINARTQLNGFVSASAVGSVVTVTNLTSRQIKIESHVGNQGTRESTVQRTARHVQLCTWSPSEAVRDAVTEPIASLLGKLQANFGQQYSDNLWGRVILEGDIEMDDDVPIGLYRRDFIVMLEYDITTKDVIYSILAGLQTESVLLE